MSYDTSLTKEQRTKLEKELRDADWPSVADDVKDGHSPDTVLSRLLDIGEGDSDATEIVARYI